MHGQQTLEQEGKEQHLERKTQGKQEGRMQRLASLKRRLSNLMGCYIKNCFHCCMLQNTLRV